MNDKARSEQLAEMASIKARISDLPDNQIEERLTLRYKYAQLQSQMLTPQTKINTTNEHD